MQSDTDRNDHLTRLSQGFVGYVRGPSFFADSFQLFDHEMSLLESEMDHGAGFIEFWNFEILVFDDFEKPGFFKVKIGLKEKKLEVIFPPHSCL